MVFSTDCKNETDEEFWEPTQQIKAKLFLRLIKKSPTFSNFADYLLLSSHVYFWHTGINVFSLT